MRTSCPAMDACGTVKPGWLDGDHPSASDGRVTRKVTGDPDVVCATE